MSSSFPPLTFHALDISGDFNEFQEVVDVFAKGCPNLEPRVSEAVCCSVISAWFNFPEYPFSIEKHLDFPDRCSRLLYAALYARAFIPGMDGKEFLDKIIMRLESHIDGKEYDLFEGTIFIPHLRTEESVRSHLKTALCYSEILKKIPGLFQRDPKYREPPFDLHLALDIQKRLSRKSRAQSFAIVGLAQ